MDVNAADHESLPILCCSAPQPGSDGGNEILKHPTNLLGGNGYGGQNERVQGWKTDL